MKIGDKVICIDDRNIQRHSPPTVMGEIYTIRSVIPYADKDGNRGVHVQESIGEIDPLSGKENPYNAARFRPFYDFCLEQLNNVSVFCGGLYAKRWTRTDIR
ncbi:MAG: hypothetical protein C4586_08440 [Anaerolineaceae bacterium]|nr:MAG: hypothetical protein C4586_08440 [Anaerolineaceae bacterium]